MKKIKMKDTILSHYQKVHELDLHGWAVRVWKPRTMQQLPAYKMLEVIDGYAEDARCALRDDDKAYWGYGNPDWGMWDALLVRYVDPRHKTLDIYFAAILVRPFSREAFEWYEKRHTGLEYMERLMLMWDSREFDRIGGYDTSYGRPSNMDEWEDALYSVECEEDDIEDTSPDFYHRYDDKKDTAKMPDSLVMRFRHKDGFVQNGTTWPVEMGVPDGFQEKLKVTLQDFLDFTKEHPEFKEMHFYTEPTEWEGENEEAGE